MWHFLTIGELLVDKLEGKMPWSKCILVRILMKYYLTNYLCSIVNTNIIEEGYELCTPYILINSTYEKKIWRMFLSSFLKAK
jgi:hypothetical protein